MNWASTFLTLGISRIIGLPVAADTQAGTYHLTVTSNSNAAADTIGGPLQGVLPQMNETQQWLLFGIGICGLSLLMLLILIWWRNRQTIKEQPK
ncbi:cell surface protein [Lactiplantibacillus paraplantarum]|uniref:Cell surface protein n=1 Tax=Lactiplantibacillus paraplantarum TaxID=60520 RepID=A0AAD0TTS1_9LACO|nr:cell surface protein [Lactiplantibacillus paraplantarum]AYJ39988.1 cell surface protein [Lactiplantibacillus paraplantarum]